jgi:hypothetical protein
MEVAGCISLVIHFEDFLSVRFTSVQSSKDQRRGGSPTGTLPTEFPGKWGSNSDGLASIASMKKREAGSRGRCLASRRHIVTAMPAQSSLSAGFSAAAERLALSRCDAEVESLLRSLGAVLMSADWV